MGQLYNLKFFETSQLQQRKFTEIIMRQIQTAQDGHVAQSAVQRLQLVITEIQLNQAHGFGKIIMSQLRKKKQIINRTQTSQTNRYKRN